MKKTITIILFLLSIFSLDNIIAQGTFKDRAVPAYAEVSENPAQITLRWDTSAYVVSTDIYKKLKTQKSFQTAPIATVMHPSNYFVDDNVQEGVQYDYMFLQTATFTNPVSLVTYAWGGVSAGIKIEINSFKGKLLVVADTMIQNTLQEKFNRFIDDLTEDGWVVNVADKTESDSVLSIKSKITSWYNQDKENSEAVILLGNIPAPYSGNFDSETLPPDAHVPEHTGAWAADVYYGVINENVFTDLITNTTGSREANRNYPGDGKFDQSSIPAIVDLQVGRIDMSNLDSVGLDYLGRTERYLDKDHNYRNRTYEVPQRYIYEDRLGLLGTEAPGRLHLFQRSLFEKDSIKQVSNNFFAKVKSTPCIWSGVSSTAGYNTIHGVGDVNNFKDSVYSVFSNYFGSYFGDWDNNNNFLRGSIGGPGYTLTSVWDGRPIYHFHHMALGENIGFSVKHTQNNTINETEMGFYTGAFERSIHLALMGDPTLRMQGLLPIENLNSQTENNNTEVKITWEESSDDDIDGYWVYRSKTAEGPFNRISEEIITDTEFTDSEPLNGDNHYMVKAVKLETTQSGTYYNLSQGRRTFVEDVDGSNNDNSVDDVKLLADIMIYPNPSNGILSFGISGTTENIKASLINLHGSIISEFEINQSDNSFDFSGLSSGVYFVKLQIGQSSKTIKWVKI